MDAMNDIRKIRMQLHRFFPVSYTAEQMRREILEMLKLNMNKYWDE